VGRRPRAPDRARTGAKARLLLPEPRPGREPRARRPSRARPAAHPRCRAPARAAGAAALHGRGVRRAASVSLLHRPHRPGDRRRDPRGTATRVRALRGVHRRRRSRPAGRADVRELEARQDPRRPGAARVLPRVARVAPHAAARRRAAGGRRDADVEPPPRRDPCPAPVRGAPVRRRRRSDRRRDRIGSPDMAGRWVAAAALLVAVGGVVWGVESGGARSAAPPPGTDQPHTLPGDNVPVLDVTHPADGASAGYIFIAEKGPKRTGGPLIVDNKGRVVWYDQLAPPLQTTDFRVQRYRGKPVLTWWAGTVDKAGVGKGSYVVYSTSYKQIARVRPKGGYPGDLHEFQLTPRGTAFITAYHEVPADLSSVGGPRQSYAYDCIVEEVDVATGRLVFEWHSIEHVPFSESVQANREPAKHATKKRPFDYFHVNSISDGPGGTILVSARNTSTIYLLARDGHI